MVNLNKPPQVIESVPQLLIQDDCFYRPFNDPQAAKAGNVLDLSPLLNADPTFDPSDFVGNAMQQVSDTGRIWALPLTVNPGLLMYDSAEFARANIPQPTNV